MKKCSISGVKALGAAAVVLLFASSTYADSRPQNGTDDQDWRREKISRDVRGNDGGARERHGDHARRDGGSSDAQQRARIRGNDSFDAGASRGNRDGQDQSNDSYRNDRGNRDGQDQSNDSYRNGRGNRNGRYQPNDSYRNDRGNRDGQYQPSDSYRNGRGNRNDGYRGDSRSYRYSENQHVNGHGRINRYSHERGGYRLWLDGAPYPYWIPEAYWRNNWRIGIGISLGGIFRNGLIYTDVYDDPYYGGGYDQRGYSQRYDSDYVSGYVDGIDYRNGTIWLHDDRSGRILTIDSRSIDPRVSGIDARDLQRGDRITVEGQWLRGGVFAADRIASVNSGRY